jgi:hypothetical protein
MPASKMSRCRRQASGATTAVMVITCRDGHGQDRERDVVVGAPGGGDGVLRHEGSRGRERMLSRTVSREPESELLFLCDYNHLR